jgi:protein SCO1
VLSLGSPFLAAQVSSYGDKEAGPTNDRPPTLLNGVGIDQHLNTQLPLNLAFTTMQASKSRWAATSVSARRFWRWFTTSAPCFAPRNSNGLTSALEMVRYVPGKDFNIIVVSIDPTEGTDLAAAKKRSM